MTDTIEKELSADALRNTEVIEELDDEFEDDEDFDDDYDEI